MGTLHKIVPVREYDLAGSFAVFAKLVVAFAKDPERYEHLEVGFLEECVTVGTRLHDEIAALTETARRGSRWATHAELRKAIKAVGERMKCDEVSVGDGADEWAGTLMIYGKRKNTVKSVLGVHASVRDDHESFYCEGDSELLHPLADELALVAGPQVAFSEHDLCDPDSIHLATGHAKEHKRRTA